MRKRALLSLVGIGVCAIAWSAFSFTSDSGAWGCGPQTKCTTTTTVATTSTSTPSTTSTTTTTIPTTTTTTTVPTTVPELGSAVTVEKPAIIKFTG